MSSLWRVFLNAQAHFFYAVKQKIQFYLEDIDTPAGKIINLAIAALVLLSSAIFIAETYPIPTTVRTNLNYLNQLILVIFTIEYGLRFWAAEHKLRHVFKLYSLIDLIAILPFLIAPINVDVRFLRILRWFRILRLVRYIEGRTIFGYVTREDSAILARILFTLFTIVFIFSGLIYQAEHPNNSGRFNTFLDAVYFSIATMTTVGFGDLTPTSQVGRLLTMLMILTGIALIPWQIGELIQQLLKASNQTVQNILCINCGLSLHDADARFCKICGQLLVKTRDACELPNSELRN